MSVCRLPQALAAWATPDFAATLQRELAALAPARLPLQQALSASSHALDVPIQAMLLGSRDHPDHIEARVGIFFAGIIAGCNCADDPTPVTAQPEYCELLLTIDKDTAAASFAPIDD